MANRGLLRRQMRKAWADTIRSAYSDQLICSERALQVHFSARLMDIFWSDEVKRRVFVEPMMQLPNGCRVHPDLLICNARSIIGVVELKYQPKKSPNYKKDFATFDSLAMHSTEIEIDNRRFLGPDSGKNRFNLSPDPMFVWAGIYRNPIRKIPEQRSEHYDISKLLVLHAGISPEKTPEIAVSSGQHFSQPR